MRSALTVAALIIALLPAVGVRGAPPEFSISQPTVRQVAEQEIFTGRAEASTTVEVRARVTGYLEKILFKEGGEVRKGEVLFQLDDRLPRAELAKAEAEVVRAEARLKLAVIENRRAAKLFELKAISREELDKIAGTVEVERAGLQVARADLDRGKVNLDFTRIVAPIDGKAGKALLNVGNLIRSGADRLTTIVVIDPLHVYFDVDERTLLRLLREWKGKGDKAPVGVGLASEKGYPREATIDFMDNRVDPKTGTLRIRAVLPNPKTEMLPGQAVRIRLSERVKG